MTEHRIFEQETIIEDDAQHREALRSDYVSGATRDDEAAGGAVAARLSARAESCRWLGWTLVASCFSRIATVAGRPAFFSVTALDSGRRELATSRTVAVRR